jgi:hypothetical protein
MKRTTVFGLLTLLVLTGLPLCATNLLTNGGFETGNFTGWTTGGNFNNLGVTSGAYSYYSGAEEGSFYAVLGPVGSDGTLAQSFSDTAGAEYTFSFWLAAVGDVTSDFSASWDGGTPLLSVTNPNTGAVWTEYTFDVIGTGLDTIQFAFRDDPAYFALDNASVDPAIPEPASLTLLGCGLLALAYRLRRRR